MSLELLKSWDRAPACTFHWSVSHPHSPPVQFYPTSWYRNPWGGCVTMHKGMHKAVSFSWGQFLSAVKPQWPMLSATVKWAPQSWKERWEVHRIIFIFVSRKCAPRFEDNQVHPPTFFFFFFCLVHPINLLSNTIGLCSWHFCLSGSVVWDGTDWCLKASDAAYHPTVQSTPDTIFTHPKMSIVWLMRK
jgi:hypothetical protein